MAVQTERRDRGPLWSVSKWFIIWDSVSDGKMHCVFEFLHQEFSDIQDNKTHSENVRLLHQSIKIFKIKFSIFSASFNSFTEKEKITIFIFIRCLVVNFKYVGFAPRKKYMAWTVSMVMVSLQNPDRERTNYSA